MNIPDAYQETQREASPDNIRIEDFLISELRRMVKEGIPEYLQPFFTMEQVQLELKGR
jgi:hypothetical protein